jgi:hypothetical protein
VPIFHGRFDERGGFAPDQPEDWKRHRSSLAGGRVEVIARKERSKRSVDQNAFWWAVPVRLLADHCGYSDSDMHYALLGECFGWKAGPTGKEIPNVTSSSVLTVEEFTRLIDWVLVWGPQELGVTIPAPSEAEAV